MSTRNRTTSLSTVGRGSAGQYRGQLGRSSDIGSAEAAALGGPTVVGTPMSTPLPRFKTIAAFSTRLVRQRSESPRCQRRATATVFRRREDATSSRGPTADRGERSSAHKKQSGWLGHGRCLSEGQIIQRPPSVVLKAGRPKSGRCSPPRSVISTLLVPLPVRVTDVWNTPPKSSIEWGGRPGEGGVGFLFVADRRDC